PDVHRAAVVAHKDRGLVAYVEGATDIRDYLLDRLPKHMVPSAFVAMDALPLTPHGKVDRRALPEPRAAEGREPRDDRERTLVDLFTEVLGTKVGIDDDFFAFGGHSLTATRLVNRIRATFHVELPVRAVFDNPTVARLAEAIEGADGMPRYRMLQTVRAFAAYRLADAEEVARLIVFAASPNNITSTDYVVDGGILRTA
ncbi:phosphopantetheine-binding protein, partial [Kibdelosporangium lantanae]